MIAASFAREDAVVRTRKISFPACYLRTLVLIRKPCDDGCALTIWLVVSGENTRSEKALKAGLGKRRGL
jgi:hypothetical protein